MAIIDFEKAKKTKTHKKHDQLNHEGPGMQKIPVELRNMGAIEIKTIDGRRLSYGELQCIVNIAKEIANKR